MATAVYFITDPQQVAAFPQLRERIEKTYSPAQNGPTAPWRLEHTVLRNVPNGPDDKTLPRFQHVFWQSTEYSDRCFSVVQGPPLPGRKEPGPPATVWMPVQQKEQWLTLLTQKMAALWSRPIVMVVPNGFTYEIGQFTVRIGELRVQNVQAPPKGVLVCVHMDLPEPDEDSPENESLNAAGVVDSADDSAKELQELFRSFCKSIGVEGAKESFAFTRSSDGEDEARLWCEALRPRT